MQLTNYQLKILRYIRKPIPAKDILEKFKFANWNDFSRTLIYNGLLLYVYENEPIYDDTLIQASSIAIAELEERRTNFIHFFVPVSISIISIIIATISLIVSIWK